jgi:opacity protein-like surface antigen
MTTMARAKLLLLTGVWTLLAAAPLTAQHISSPYRFLDTRQAISIFGGRLITQTGSVGLGPASGTTVGARLDYRTSASGPFVIELNLGYAPLKRTVRDTTRSEPDSAYNVYGTATQGVLVATAALRFDLTGARTWHRLQPYALLGVGGAFGTSSANGADVLVPQESRFSFGTSFAAQVGGGIEWYATRRVALRLDGRGTLWKLHTPRGFLVKDVTLPPSEWVQNVSLTAGLALHF